MPGVLALDLSSNTGWATLARPDDEPRHGTHRVSLPSASVGKFLFDYEMWLCDMLTVHEPRFVAFEAPILMDAGMKNLDTAMKLIGLATHTMKVCHVREIRCARYNVASVKKHFTGNGRAEKPDMISAAVARGWAPEDHNAADALGLLCLAMTEVYPQSRHALTPIERRAAG